MNKLRKFLAKYVWYVVAIAFFIAYLVLKTPDIQTLIAVPVSLYLLLGSMFISQSFFRNIFHQNIKFIKAIDRNKLSFLLFIFAGISLYYLKGWKFFSAFMIGAIGFWLFFFLLFFFTRNSRYKGVL